MLLLPNEIQSLILQFCSPKALMLFSLTSLNNHLRLNATLPKIPTKVKCGDLSEEYTLSEKGLISTMSYKYTSTNDINDFRSNYPRGNKDQIKYMRSGRVLLPGSSPLMYIYTKGEKIDNLCPTNYNRERRVTHNSSWCADCSIIRQLQGKNLLYNRHQKVAELWIKRGYINGSTVSGDGSLLKYTNVDWQRKIRLDVIVKYLNKEVTNLNIVIHQKIEVLEHYLAQGKEYVLGYSWEFSYHSARPKVLKWLFAKGLIEKRHLLCSISRLYDSQAQDSYQDTGIIPFVIKGEPIYNKRITDSYQNTKSKNKCHSCFCKPFMPSLYPILNPLPFYKWLFTSNIGVGNTGANITFEDINAMSGNGCFQNINSFELLPPNLLEWSCGIHKINDVYCEDKTNPVNYRMHPIDDGILPTISTGILATRPTKHSINHAICYDDIFRLKIALHFITPSEEDLENASRNNKIEAMKLLLHFNNVKKCISDAAMKHCYYWAPEGIKEIMLPYM